ncbi:NAD(P)-dependent dehydrogenase (short-subunit alcohol dehydrogenase family) [Microbacterium sp. SLBN-154]|uniref:SDR family NAD(P)-dependent oxidoreductase n=1 Tax=Microbacterium sp. SLBN-154 TaxID=2768458 RepID=UPI001168874F|nr:SDR family oxidoreductase [Microbacterium sp. SLBN-154]TQK17677.1 NAD(P)-dependent dehydrogenase (short-subunit alcohol dehydrogenase family) [Microbacterium sp. SLBN-154]
MSSPPTAVITGGAGDIGGTIARTLSRDGFRVTITDVLPEETGRVRADELSVGMPVEYHHVDTTLAADVGAVIERGEGPLDVAVLCAGMVRAQPFLSVGPEVWRRTLDVNLTGAFLAAQAAARRMVARKTEGVLIFVSSWVAERPWPEISAYSASKAGMNQLMRSAALELSAHGIRANAVAPGIVMAGLARTQFETEPQYAARASRAIPLGRPQTPQQIADAVAFLASPAAESITGSVFTVDAGSSLGTLS